MASGISVHPACIEAFQALSKRSYSAVVYKINDGMTSIVVDKTFPPSKGNLAAEWKSFVSTLPADDCRYIATDFLWSETPTVQKSKLCMILWSPDTASIRSKMVYASSEQAFQNSISVQRSLQATDIDEMSYMTIKDAVTK